MIREHRLINARASTVTTDPTQYNARTAQANAAQQTAQHQAQLAANQAQTTGLNAQGQGTLAAPVAAVPKNQALANAQTTYAANAAGQATTMQQSVGPNGQVVQSPITQAQSLDGNGVLQQSAIDRMRSEGLSEAEIRSRMGNYSQKVQGAMEQVGQAYQNPDSAFANGGSQNALDRASGRLSLQQQADKAAEDAKQQYLQMGVGDPAIIAQAQSQARQNVLNEQAAQTGLQTAQGQKQQQDLVGNAAAGNAAGKQAGSEASQAPVVSPQQNATNAAANMLLAGLTPEQQSLMAPAVNAIMSAYDQADQNSSQLYDETLNIAEGQYKQEQSVLGLLGKSYKELKDSTQSVLDEVKDDQLKNIAEQEKVTQERLGWERAKAERELKRQETKVQDQMIARLALSGGFGSDGGLNEINSATAEFESKIADLGVEYSLQQSEVAVKFSTLYTNTLNQYKVDSISNLKTYQADLERLSMQSLASDRSFGEAKQKAMETYLNNQTNTRLAKAKDIQGITKDVQGLIIQNKSDSQAQEQYGMQQLKWVIDTYGQNAPQSLIENISKSVPGLDVNQIIQTLTLEQQKKASGGSGGFSLSFPGRIMDATGLPPSFESFLRAKEEEAGMSFDEPQIAELRKEYEATLSATKQNDPSELYNRFEQRATAQNLSGPIYKRTASLIDQYMQNGQYDQAAAIIDNIGDDIDSTTSLKFTQALTARADIVQLHQALQDVGKTGPITGRIRSLNPYDPAVVRVNRLITQTVPNLARGVFNEVGVLTDQDVARYTQTLENTNLTVEQAQQTFTDLMRKLDVGMQNQISVWDAQNKRTKGFKQILSSQTSTPIDDPNEAFAQSILSGQ